LNENGYYEAKPCINDSIIQANIREIKRKIMGDPRGGCGEYSFLSRDFLDCGGGIGKNFRRRHICSCFPSAADMVS
jgi:hypothetical protein